MREGSNFNSSRGPLWKPPTRTSPKHMSSDPEVLLSPLVDAARSGTVSEYLRDLAAPGSALASALFEADPRRSGVVCDSVVDVLNDTEAGSKVKVRALVALAELARDPRGRDVVMRAVRRMDDVFEKSFVEKEDVRPSAPSLRLLCTLPRERAPSHGRL